MDNLGGRDLELAKQQCKNACLRLWNKEELA